MEIKLLDENLDIIGDPIDDYSSLTYTDKWEESGSFTAVMSNDHYANVAAASYVYFDSRTYEIETLSSEDVLTISGQDLSAMLDRIAIYDVERLHGRLEEMARYLVAKYAMSGSQLIPKLVLETDNDFKRAMDVTTERGSLGAFLRTALNQRDFSFSLDYDITLDKIVFHLLRSTDRSQDQETNATVMFSSDSGNIEKITYKRTIKDYRNFAYVCDEDATAPQTVEVDLSNGEPIRAMYVSGKSAGADTSAASNLYVMVGQSSSGVGYIATSTDGQTWTDRITTGHPSLWGIDYSNGVFLACGNAGEVLTSTDGVSWTNGNISTAYAMEGALYDDGLYIVVGNNAEIWAGFDGSTWTKRVGESSLKVVSPINFLGTLLATSSSTNKIYIFLSGNLWNWTFSTMATNAAATSSQPNRVLRAENNALIIGSVVVSAVIVPFVARGTEVSGSIAWEYDEISALSGHSFLDAAYGNGILVAIGQPNIIAWSDDLGATWTDCTPSGGTPNYITVCFNETNGTFHAYSYTGKYHAYSSDGKNWTLSTFTASVFSVDAVIYGTSSHSGNLRQIGIDALQATRTADIIDGEILPDVEPIYGTDYVVGDIADIKDAERGILAAKRIVEVQHIREPNQIVTIPKFGVNFLNLRQYISKEIKTNG